MNAKADLAKLRAARNRASRAYRERQKAAGIKARSFKLSPDTLDRLAKLAKARGVSETKAVELALSECALHVGVVRAGDVVERVAPKRGVFDNPHPLTSRRILDDPHPLTNGKRPNTPPKPPKGSGKRPEGVAGRSGLSGPVGTDGKPLPARKPAQKGTKK